MFIRILFTIIILLVLGVFVAKSVDLPQIITLLKNFPIPTLLTIIILAIAILVLKAARFIFLLKIASIPVTFWEATKVSLAGQATSSLPAGEMLRGYLIRKEAKIDMARTAGPILMQGLLEVSTALVFTAVGSIFIKELRIPALILLVIISIVFFLLFHETFLHKFLEKLPNIKFLDRITRKIISIHKKIHSTMISNKKGGFKTAIIQTVLVISISNIIGGVMIYLISTAFSANLTVFQSIFVYSSSIVISTIGGITPGGLGFTESGMTGILLLFGNNFTVSIAIVLLFRLMTFVFSTASGIIFLCVFYGKELMFKKNKKNEK